MPVVSRGGVSGDPTEPDDVGIVRLDFTYDRIVPGVVIFAGGDRYKRKEARVKLEIQGQGADRRAAACEIDLDIHHVTVGNGIKRTVLADLPLAAGNVDVYRFSPEVAKDPARAMDAGIVE